MFISALILLIFCADIRDEARDQGFTGAGGFIIILAEKPRFKGKLKLKFYSAQRVSAADPKYGRIRFSDPRQRIKMA